MSNCGNCRSRLCSCQFIGNANTAVLGLGSSMKPYQARPVSPTFRPIAQIFRNTSQGIAADISAPITFHEEDSPLQHEDLWDVVLPTRIRIPVAGMYLIGGMASQSNTGSATIWRVWIAKNGNSAAPLVQRTVTDQSGVSVMFNDVMTLERFNVNDYIELWIRSNRTGGTATVAGVASPGNTITANPTLWVNYMGV